MEAQREELNATLEATTADKDSVESQIIALDASKADIEARLNEALAKIDTLVTRSKSYRMPSQLTKQM